MWLYLLALVGLWTLLRLFRERQVVSDLQDKYVFITGCGSGFGNLLARQLDRRGMRVLAACRKEEGAKQLRNKTSDRLETVILDVTSTESIVAATQWVKERVGNRGTIEIPVCVVGFWSVGREGHCNPEKIPVGSQCGVGVIPDFAPLLHNSLSSYIYTESSKRPRKYIANSCFLWAS